MPHSAFTSVLHRREGNTDWRKIALLLVFRAFVNVLKFRDDSFRHYFSQRIIKLFHSVDVIAAAPQDINQSMLLIIDFYFRNDVLVIYRCFCFQITVIFFSSKHRRHKALGWSFRNDT